MRMALESDLFMATDRHLSSSRPAAVTIRASDTTWSLQCEELWRHRELLYFLTWRDIKVRYKQTVLGIAWAVLQPLAIALTVSIFFGRLAKVPSEGLPYFVFAYSATVVWQLFAQVLTESSNSLLANERLITKVYFPRLIFPLSAALASVLDFFISLVVLELFLVHYRIALSATAVILLPMVLLAVLIALGIGLWLAALNVRYRDVRYTVGFLVQVWFLATPIAYPVSVVPERLRIWYSFNPMVGVIEGFRYGLRGSGAAPVHLIAASVCVAVVLFMSGLYYFRRTEDFFADFI